MDVFGKVKAQWWEVAQTLCLFWLKRGLRPNDIIIKGLGASADTSPPLSQNAFSSYAYISYRQPLSSYSMSPCLYQLLSLTLTLTLNLSLHLIFSVSVGDEWYLCRLSLSVPTLADLQWGMFPQPYLGAVGPDAAPGSVVYRLTARQQDGTIGNAHFLLLGGE